MELFAKKASIILIVWTVTYVVCAGPISFLNALVWGLIFKVGMNYTIYQHPESPFRIALLQMNEWLIIVLATLVTVNIYQALWPKHSN